MRTTLPGEGIGGGGGCELNLPAPLAQFLLWVCLSAGVEDGEELLHRAAGLTGFGNR